VYNKFLKTKWRNERKCDGGDDIYSASFMHINHTRIHGFYFFFLAFFLPPPFPERLRFTDFGERSLAVPFVVPFIDDDPFAFAAAFFTGILSLFSRSKPNFPLARKCCWTNSFKAPSCASIVRNVVMNSS
jgi:hypothetical protein